MNKHLTGACGIDTAHSDEDHVPARSLRCRVAVSTGWRARQCFNRAKTARAISVEDGQEYPVCGVHARRAAYLYVPHGKYERPVREHVS